MVQEMHPINMIPSQTLYVSFLLQYSLEVGDIASAVAAMRVHLIHSKEAAFESLMQ